MIPRLKIKTEKPEPDTTQTQQKKWYHSWHESDG
jgi:hypothetical protein